HCKAGYMTLLMADKLGIGAAMRDLDAAAGRPPVLPPGGRYEHALLTGGHCRATVRLPAEPPLRPGAPVAVRELQLA
ncbi:hypothetical protein ABT317_49035, partial [Streptomyces carpinensis]